MNKKKPLFFNSYIFEATLGSVCAGLGVGFLFAYYIPTTFGLFLSLFTTMVIAREFGRMAAEADFNHWRDK